MIHARSTRPAWMEPALFEAVKGYALFGHDPLPFLTAVLSHELFDAFGRADDNSARCMQSIVRFIYNDLPSNCHGSRDLVDGWIDVGGLRGLAEAQAAHDDAQTPEQG